MHLFIAKFFKGRILPVEEKKLVFWNKLLKDYEDKDMCFKVTIEVVGKNINGAQKSLYNAFIYRASDHFGNSFNDMKIMLHILEPRDPTGILVPIERWSTDQLNRFIDEANVMLLGISSDFKF